MYDIVKERRSTSTAGSSIIVGKIVGGSANVLTTTTSEETETNVYPGSKPQAFPASLFNEDAELVTIPSIENWDNAELPSEYATGDPLPDGLADSNGICYVKLERPFSYQGKSWAANILSGFEYTGEDDGKPHFTRAISNETFTSVLVYFDVDISPIDDLGNYSFSFSVTRNGQAYSEIFSENVSIDTDQPNAFNITLSEALNPETDVATISFDGVTVLTSTEGPILNDSVSSTITFFGEKNTIIYAANFISVQSFVEGDLVLIDTSRTYVIADEQEGSDQVTKTVPAIIGPVNTARIHDHSSFARDGLGRASLSPWESGN